MRGKINCLQCDKEIQPYSGGQLQKYCSQKCETKYKWRLKYPFTPILKTCLNCQKEFYQTINGKPRKYCSSNCCRMYWRKNDGKEKNRLIQKRQDEKRKVKPEKRFYDIKYQAGIRRHPFVLTYKQFLSFWNGICHYCGEQIIGVGIDRIDSSKGYEISNCISCCTICNKMKNTQSQQDFIKRCKLICDKLYR